MAAQVAVGGLSRRSAQRRNPVAGFQARPKRSSPKTTNPADWTSMAKQW